MIYDANYVPLTNILRGTDADPSIMNIINAIPRTMPFDLSMLKGMGMLNSHKYRDIFIAICKKHGYSSEVQFYIILAATIVKDPERIKRGLAAHSNIPVIAKVIQFYSSNSVKYVGDVKPTTMYKLFPTVKIPETFPSIAALCFILVEGKDVHPSDIVQAMTRNLWFCQLDVSDELLDLQKKWEEIVFWGVSEDTGMVQKSKFSGTRAPGQKLVFNKDIHDTKKGDNYPLILPDGRTWQNKVNAKQLEEFVAAAIDYYKIGKGSTIAETKIAEPAAKESILDQGVSAFANFFGGKKVAEEKKELADKVATELAAITAENAALAEQAEGGGGEVEGEGLESEVEGGDGDGVVGEDVEAVVEDLPPLEADEGVEAPAKDTEEEQLEGKRRIYPTPAAMGSLIRSQIKNKEYIESLAESYMEFWNRPEDNAAAQESYDVIAEAARGFGAKMQLPPSE